MQEENLCFNSQLHCQTFLRPIVCKTCELPALNKLDSPSCEQRRIENHGAELFRIMKIDYGL